MSKHPSGACRLGHHPKSNLCQKCLPANQQPHYPPPVAYLPLILITSKTKSREQEKRAYGPGCCHTKGTGYRVGYAGICHLLWEALQASEAVQNVHIHLFLGSERTAVVSVETLTC